MLNYNDPLLNLFDSVSRDDNQVFTYRDIKITYTEENTKTEIINQVDDTGQPFTTHPVHDSNRGQLVAYSVGITTTTHPIEDKERVIHCLDSFRNTLDFPSDNGNIF